MKLEIQHTQCALEVKRVLSFITIVEGEANFSNTMYLLLCPIPISKNYRTFVFFQHRERRERHFFWNGMVVASTICHKVQRPT